MDPSILIVVVPAGLGFLTGRFRVVFAIGAAALLLVAVALLIPVDNDREGVDANGLLAYFVGIYGVIAVVAATVGVLLRRLTTSVARRWGGG